MPAAPVETDADRESWRNLLAIAVEAAGTQVALAEILREDKSTINRWLKGERALAWTMLRAALRRVALRRPAGVPDMVAALASELLDARGRWIPEGVAVGDFDTEADDVDIAWGELVRARRSGDAARIRAAIAEWQRQVDEAAAAATLEAK